VPERLIADARGGSQDAFAAIYRTYEPPLRRYLDAVSPGLAAEVSSATWESVAASLRSFSGDGDRFRGWLFTIARRRLVDEVRRSTRRPLAVADVPESATCDAHDVEHGPDWAVSVLRSIPTRQADVVALRVIGGLSAEEVAGLLGVTPENVRVLCHRGLKAIRSILEPAAPVGSEASRELRSVV
jgi:RNA polymerase sigma-70 factor (ECF subfamily)